MSLTRRLREWSEIPILVLSAVGDEEEKVRALEAGADDYVTKPFGARELVARLHAALRRSAPAEEEPRVVVDGLEIDLAGRSVRRDSEPVHLTPIEFDLLRTLVRNRGRLLTHRALLTEVWGPGYEEDIQPLRTHIAQAAREDRAARSGRAAADRHRAGSGLQVRRLTAAGRAWGTHMRAQRRFFTKSLYAGWRSL